MKHSLFSLLAASCAFVLSSPNVGGAQTTSHLSQSDGSQVGRALQNALRATVKGQWDEALALAPRGIGSDLVLWLKLREGEGTLGEYEDFLNRRADWPGLALLRQKGETAVARSITPQRITAYFDKDRPRTAAGALTLISSLQALGQSQAAARVGTDAWLNLRFSAEEEQTFAQVLPQVFQETLPQRLENLLWAARRSEAERLLPYLAPDQQALARARIALRAEAAGVDDLLAKVPAALQNSPGLLHDRFAWRMRKDLYESAADLLLQVPPENLGRAEPWAERRALLVRWLLRQGRPRDAYRMAALHGLQTGAAFADLEFLAGFVALRKLDNPLAASHHFARVEAEVSTAISLSRALYWQARAAEALGQSAQAQGLYQAAARHQTAYYGLLAAEKLGMTLDSALLVDHPPADWRGAAFAQASVLQAGLLLLEAGERAQAKRFFLHLAESLDGEELAQLADLALQKSEPHLAVVIAKQAAERGVIVPRAYYPMPDFVPDGLAVSRALALAIARRESEFDPGARSHADARGLMQVLPGTAKLVAKDLGLDYAPEKLIAEPAFNVKVGSAYLARMLDNFGPSIALIASGYNAGPGRPKRWIEELGDPRLDQVDVVDWVESIPFGETRTYVMRVVEGVVIYRAKLRGTVGPVRITPELKG